MIKWTIDGPSRVEFVQPQWFIDIGPSSQLIRELSRPNLLVDSAMLVHNVRIPDRSLYVRNQNELNSFGIKKLVVAENFAAGKAA